MKVGGLVGLGLAVGLAAGAAAQSNEAARWQAEVARVRIVRDDWGIAHVHGKTDADAVFGMIYAQCEDDFNRVETNYLNSLGRLAEAEGEGKIWQDLRQKLFVDPVELKAEYAGSPAWLKALMDAWADGVNYFLATHAAVKPRVIARFEPWMALSFTEGSIGGDIERVDLKKLEAFYGGTRVVPGPGVMGQVSALAEEPLSDQGDGEPRGSNGVAIAPSHTRDGHALLLINPHTSFFFRSELQMTSDEGLNAYGAVTWGQIFVYQGFNERAGWMHTSSGVDAVDEYLEKVTASGSHWLYRYGTESRGVRERYITLPYKTADGMKEKTITAYFTSHGPVVRSEGGAWVSIQLMNTPVAALEQSFGRTKARSYKEFAQTMELKANSSNNTIFADADGDIAYWHGNFIPKRDVRFDYTKPVDGTDPATDWHGLMTVQETPHLLNPKSGYLFNVNNSPWAGAGESSLRKADYPAYVEQGTESARGLHAMRVFGAKDFTAETLRLAAYDSYLPWFAETVPALVKAWDGMAAGPDKDQVKAQIDVLRGWDFRWSVGSVATSLAVFWGEEVRRQCGATARTAGMAVEDYVAGKAAPEVLVAALQAASDRLRADFGTWSTKWGEINRFQRLTGDIVQPFTDAGASIPVGFTSSLWGSLASFGARPYPGTKKWYGTSGNSFVAVVEFGPKVRARAVTAGGESGQPGSKHFDDEAGRYSTEDLREVYFYPEQLVGHTERVYAPGK